MKCARNNKNLIYASINDRYITVMIIRERDVANDERITYNIISYNSNGFAVEGCRILLAVFENRIIIRDR